MNKYKVLRERQQKEFNGLPMFFAFSEKQFNEGMEKFGLSPNDTDKIVSIGCGGFMKKVDSHLLHEMSERHEKERADAINEDLTGEDFICDMFDYELGNHEFTYTGEVDDALVALGITASEIQADPRRKRGFELAMKKQWEWSELYG